MNTALSTDQTAAKQLKTKPRFALFSIRSAAAAAAAAVPQTYQLNGTEPNHARLSRIERELLRMVYELNQIVLKLYMNFGLLLRLHVANNISIYFLVKCSKRKKYIICVKPDTVSGLIVFIFL